MIKNTYIMTNKKIMHELSKDSEFFESEAHRIFIIIGTKIDINNYAETTIKEIGNELDISDETVIKGIEILENKGLLIKDNYGFKLNSNVIYRRTVEEDDEISESQKDINYYNKIYDRLIKEIDEKKEIIENLSKRYNLPKEVIYSIIENNLNKE